MEKWDEWNNRLLELRKLLVKMRVDFSAVVIRFNKDLKKREKARKRGTVTGNAELYNLALAQYRKYQSTTGEANDIADQMLAELDIKIKWLQEQKTIIQQYQRDDKEQLQWLEALTYMKAKMLGEKAPLPSFLQSTPKGGERNGRRQNAGNSRKHSWSTKSKS